MLDASVYIISHPRDHFALSVLQNLLLDNGILICNMNEGEDYPPTEDLFMELGVDDWQVHYDNAVHSRIGPDEIDGMLVADSVIVLMTPHFATSNKWQACAQFALDISKKTEKNVLTILVRGSKNTAVPSFLQPVNFLDMRKPFMLTYLRSGAVYPDWETEQDTQPDLYAQLEYDYGDSGLDTDIERLIGEIVRDGNGRIYQGVYEHYDRSGVLTRRIDPETVDKKYDFMISHSSQDKSIVYEIRDELYSMGKTFWIDDQGRKGSQHFIGSEIDQAILESHCLLLVASANAYESDWVRAEIEFAVKYNIPVLPVFVNEPNESDLHQLIRRQNGIRTTDVEHEEDVIEVARRLKLETFLARDERFQAWRTQNHDLHRERYRDELRVNDNRDIMICHTPTTTTLAEKLKDTLPSSFSVAANADFAQVPQEIRLDLIKQATLKARTMIVVMSPGVDTDSAAAMQLFNTNAAGIPVLPVMPMDDKQHDIAQMLHLTGPVKTEYHDLEEALIKACESIGLDTFLARDKRAEERRQKRIQDFINQHQYSGSYQLLISHSSHHNQLAEDIAQFLQRSGIVARTSKSLHSIPPMVRQDIETKVLKQMPALLVLTDNSPGTPLMREQIEYAVNNSLSIYPVYTTAASATHHLPAALKGRTFAGDIKTQDAIIAAAVEYNLATALERDATVRKGLVAKKAARDEKRRQDEAATKALEDRKKQAQRLALNYEPYLHTGGAPLKSKQSPAGQATKWMLLNPKNYVRHIYQSDSRKYVQSAVKIELAVLAMLMLLIMWTGYLIDHPINQFELIVGTIFTALVFIGLVLNTERTRVKDHQNMSLVYAGGILLMMAYTTFADDQTAAGVWLLFPSLFAIMISGILTVLITVVPRNGSAVSTTSDLLLGDIALLVLLPLMTTYTFSFHTSADVDVSIGALVIRLVWIGALHLAGWYIMLVAVETTISSSFKKMTVSGWRKWRAYAMFFSIGLGILLLFVSNWIVR